LRLGFAGGEFGYSIELGLPPQARESPSAFRHDPEIKRECLWSGEVLRHATLLVDRRGSVVKVRNDDGRWTIVTSGLSTFDSMMTHCADPRNAPEMLMLREHIRGWRFYDQLRTDATAPARSPQIGTHTPVLGHDGADLAAALQTIVEIGNGDALNASVADAFRGSSVQVRALTRR
jgi:predicted ATPase